MKTSLLLLCLSCIAPVSASPLTDLGSPSPEVRKNAAETIRDKHLYTPVDRKSWDQFIASIKPDDTDADILDRLAKVTAPKHALDSNDLKFAGIYTLPLDDSWAMKLIVNGSHIIHIELIEQAKEIVVPPPAGFTGCWRTYRIDGSPVLRWYDQGHHVGPPGDYGDRSPASSWALPEQ